MDHEVSLRNRRQLHHHLRLQHGWLLPCLRIEGWLQVAQAFVYEGLRLRAEFSGTKLDELNPARDPSHFQAEAEHFSNCVLNNLQPQSPGEEGLTDMRLITKIYRSAGITI